MRNPDTKLNITAVYGPYLLRFFGGTEGRLDILLEEQVTVDKIYGARRLKTPACGSEKDLAVVNAGDSK